MSFLRRNIYRFPRETKTQCFKTLVRPILEYASPAWDPHTANNISSIEKVQRRAARFVTNNYSTTSSTSEMIQNLEWPSLQQRRSDAKLVMMYRITYNLIDIPAAAYLHPSGLTTRGHSLRYFTPYCRTDTYRYSFFQWGIRLWNQLPEHLVTVSTLECFKAGLTSTP